MVRAHGAQRAWHAPTGLAMNHGAATAAVTGVTDNDTMHLVIRPADAPPPSNPGAMLVWERDLMTWFQNLLSHSSALLTDQGQQASNAQAGDPNGLNRVSNWPHAFPIRFSVSVCPPHFAYYRDTYTFDISHQHCMQMVTTHAPPLACSSSKV